MNISRIFHGGAGGRGSSTGYGGTIVNKLFDQLGHLLLEGATWLLHIKSGVTVQADNDLTVHAVRDANVTIDRNLSATVNYGNIDSATAMNTYGVDYNGMISDHQIELRNNGNGVTDLITMFSDRDIEQTASNELRAAAGIHMYLVSHGNSVDLVCDGPAAACSVILAAPTIQISSGHASGQIIILAVSGKINVPVIKSGANQGAAGAVAGDLWHDTTDNSIKYGV